MGVGGGSGPGGTPRFGGVTSTVGKEWSQMPRRTQLSKGVHSAAEQALAKSVGLIGGPETQPAGPRAASGTPASGFAAEQPQAAASGRSHKTAKYNPADFFK